MAANAINNFFGAQTQGFGLASFGGMGLATSTKPPQLERYHEEHGWQKSSSKGKKGNVALSALTLLAFLFFLHILQNCIQEHMVDMKGGNKNKGVINANLSGIMGLPNVIVIGSNTNARDNLKGDDGNLPISQEDVNNWKAKTFTESKHTHKGTKPRAKKNQQQKHDHKPRSGQVVAVKNTIPGVINSPESFNSNRPMHRIDNVP